MKENLKEDAEMDVGNMFSWKGWNIKVTGRTICSMERDNSRIAQGLCNIKG